MAPVAGRAVCTPSCKLAFTPRELVIGEEWEGIVSKITDFGCFVSLGGGQHLGLVHVKELSNGLRLPREEVEGFVEETVGPVGSKVRVELIQLEFKGSKRISLTLREVIKKQRLDDVVFAPGPRRMRGVARDGHGPGDPNEQLDDHERVPF